jgi:hypothetical protein
LSDAKEQAKQSMTELVGNSLQTTILTVVLNMVR